MRRRRVTVKKGEAGRSPHAPGAACQAHLRALQRHLGQLLWVQSLQGTEAGPSQVGS